jgi:alkylresorcinol/alkylpyrone synthase
MSPPKIVASATAVPPHRFDQETLVRIAGYADAQRAGFFANSQVVFVLEDVLRTASPTPGDWGLMIALGPGFAAEGALLRW